MPPPVSASFRRLIGVEPRPHVGIHREEEVLNLHLALAGRRRWTTAKSSGLGIPTGRLTSWISRVVAMMAGSSLNSDVSL